MNTAWIACTSVALSLGAGARTAMSPVCGLAWWLCYYEMSSTEPGRAFEAVQANPSFLWMRNLRPRKPRAVGLLCYNRLHLTPRKQNTANSGKMRVYWKDTKNVSGKNSRKGCFLLGKWQRMAAPALHALHQLHLGGRIRLAQLGSGEHLGQVGGVTWWAGLSWALPFSRDWWFGGGPQRVGKHLSVQPEHRARLRLGSGSLAPSFFSVFGVRPSGEARTSQASQENQWGGLSGSYRPCTQRHWEHVGFSALLSVSFPSPWPLCLVFIWGTLKGCGQSSVPSSCSFSDVVRKTNILHRVWAEKKLPIAA